jgi:hypothetical protein
MTAATELAAALTPILGAPDERIHTAIPPIHLVGGADVLVFPSTKWGVLYVSAGLGTTRGRELVLCVPRREDWCAPFVSRLAAAFLTRPLVTGGTTPLGDGPYPAIALASLHGLFRVAVPSQKHGLGLALILGLTSDELAVCRTHGVQHVVELARRAGAYPQSPRDRASLVDPRTAGPSVVDDPRLSDDGRDALHAVIHGRDDDIEGFRNQFPKTDLPVLAAAYDRLISFEQRVSLVFLTCDSVTPELQIMCRAYVRDALAEHAVRPIRSADAAHAALATAVALLDGNLGDFERYYDDVEDALKAARARV